MRVWTKLIGFIIVAVVYCFTVSMVNDPFKDSVISLYSEIESENHYSIEQGKGLAHVMPSVQQIYIAKNHFFRPVKSSSHEFSALIKVADQFAENIFSQQKSFFFDFPIEIQKAKIIFPFHSFW